SSYLHRRVVDHRVAALLGLDRGGPVLLKAEIGDPGAGQQHHQRDEREQPCRPVRGLGAVPVGGTRADAVRHWIAHDGSLPGVGRNNRDSNGTIGNDEPTPATESDGERDVSGLRLMAVHAHPDDESSKGAATTARYADEGHEVLVVSLTGGERGSILNPAMDTPGVLERIHEIRREEMAAAARALGVSHRWLGFVDSGLPQGDPPPPLPDGSSSLVPLEEATEALVRVVREFRPHVITTYDETGGYPHPDHIACHKVSVAAFEAAGDPERFPDAGEPWTPLKLYYSHGFVLRRLEIFAEEYERIG